MVSDPGVRVRFCPSPTGNPHVGLVRTALFNWAYARHVGGTFVFRIEDTDAARDSETSYDQLLAALRWLGLDWDEGPEVGGPYGPYRQSQRLDIYADVAARLLAAGLAYESFSTPEEVAQRRRDRGEDPVLGYDNADRHLTAGEIAALRAAGREPVLRLAMPERDWHWDDLIRGDITVPAGQVPDFVIVRAGGQPLYTLVNPVDDAMMRITHVLRGEDLLSSTPRQLAMYEALASIGVAHGSVPRFGHLPYVMGEGNRKLSKRDPQSSLDAYRDAGYLPEGLLNYLALLGWSLGPDRDVFGRAELVEHFELDRVSANPARFDVRKAEAINAAHLRALPADELAAALVPFLAGAGLVGTPPTPQQAALVDAVVPLVQSRMTVLGDAPALVGFLFSDDVVVDPDVAAALDDEAPATLAAAERALADLQVWDAASLEAALRAALVEGLGLKPKVAFTPVRVAVTGSRVAPPLFESLELLGAPRTLERLRALADQLGPGPAREHPTT